MGRSKLRFADYEVGTFTEVPDRGVYWGDDKVRDLLKKTDLDDCPNCSGTLEDVVSREDGEDHVFYMHGSVMECQSCGWWTAFKTFADFETDYRPVISKVYHSVVKKFSISDRDPSILDVHRELKKNKDSISKMNKTAFEKYMQAVLSESYSCKVKHVGQTNDGGIDLLMIERDEPIIVQVKNRELWKTEGVETVRSFLGSMLDNDIYRGMILSTAKTFTRGSRQMASRNLANGKVQRLDLKNCNEILEMIGALNSTNEQLWKPIFNKLWGSDDI